MILQSGKYKRTDETWSQRGGPVNSWDSHISNTACMRSEVISWLAISFCWRTGPWSFFCVCRWTRSTSESPPPSSPLGRRLSPDRFPLRTLVSDARAHCGCCARAMRNRPMFLAARLRWESGSLWLDVGDLWAAARHSPSDWPISLACKWNESINAYT